MSPLSWVGLLPIRSGCRASLLTSVDCCSRVRHVSQTAAEEQERSVDGDVIIDCCCDRGMDADEVRGIRPRTQRNQLRRLRLRCDPGGAGRSRRRHGGFARRVRSTGNPSWRTRRARPVLLEERAVAARITTAPPARKPRPADPVPTVPSPDAFVPEPPVAREPAWIEAAPAAVFAAARSWLLGGKTIVRLGLVILFVGLSFLASYAASAGLFPIEWRWRSLQRSAPCCSL